MRRSLSGAGRRCMLRPTRGGVVSSAIDRVQRSIPVSRIHAQNFRSFRDVDVQLGPLTVLVGPNGSGKSNLLKVLQFISTAARFDLDVALSQWGGFDHVLRQSTRAQAQSVELEIEGQVTRLASENAPDHYRLLVTRKKNGELTRTEELAFKRLEGRGRRIKVRDSAVTIEAGELQTQRNLASRTTTGLGALAQFAQDEVGPQPAAYVRFLTSMRVLEPDVAAAREPSRYSEGRLADDAHNLASALANLQAASTDAFAALVSDLAACLPGLERIELAPIGGAGRAFVVQLHERGVRRPIELADASYGTVRLLALLVALHEPDPPAFTAIEELDHGLHPYALEVLVDRMRAASAKTQILAATHSPTLVNRLEPHEVLIAERDYETGESIIPARNAEEIASAIRSTVDEDSGSSRGIGELWFAGALGGVPA